MENPLKLKTKDGFTIYGVLNTSPKKSSALTVFVHGLTGDLTDHIFYNAARFFPSKGIDVFRFNLYDGRKGGRSLVSSSIRTHAADLNQVLKRFRKDYKHIVVVGHSLGGPAVITADTKLMDSIILWDPTGMPSLSDVSEGMKRPLKYIRSLKAYLAEWNFTFLLGEEMAKEYDDLQPISLIKNVHVPLKIICAEKAGNAKPGKQYFTNANSPKEYVVIQGATHCFDEWGAEEQLFKETLAWVKAL
jgi:pimeloyl-ACP methyl ester carboxylesterase